MVQTIAPRITMSIFGKSLLNGTASRLHLPSQRGQSWVKWSRPLGRGSGRYSERSSVAEGTQEPSGSRPWTAEEGQEALHMCPHIPRCPESTAPDREAAHTIASHPEQGWSLLCNGVVIFDDTGELLPNGATIAPHRPTDHQAPAA